MKILIAALLVFSFQSANAQFLPFAKESDSGIDGPPYAKIEQELATLESEFQGHADHIVYGKTVKGLNLNLIRISNPQAQVKNPKAVIITGSTHGDEYLNVEDRLPRAFLSDKGQLDQLQKFLETGGIIYIAPIFNPDGYTADRRYNSNGIDLNRDFSLPPIQKVGFSQPETGSFIKYIEEDLTKSNGRLVFSMDYHCCAGAFLYPWAYTFDPMNASDLARFKAISNVMRPAFENKYPADTTINILGYTAEGTSKDFYFATTGALSFTFEGAWGTENKNFSKHLTMWNLVFGHLNSSEF
jgi:hypothetical protein